MHLCAWPDAERRSRIVFMVRDMEAGRIAESLAVFNLIGGVQPHGSQAARTSALGAEIRRITWQFLPPANLQAAIGTNPIAHP